MDVELIRKFKSRMAKQPVIGPFSKTCDPALIEIMGHAGFDHVILDMEHGPNTLETVQHLVRAAELTGLLPIVRVADNSETCIGQVLDTGACGVQVPQVRNAAEAEATVHAAKFAPDGMRGICKFVRAADYSALDRLDYFKQANVTLVILQLEGKEAFDDLDAILSVKGIDILFLGIMDLSQSLGVAGHMDHPKVVEKLQKISERCKKSSISVGTYADSPEIARQWTGLGVRYIGCNVDVGIFLKAGQDMVNAFKG